MSNWTHAICVDCWNERNPNRQAVDIIDELAERETCCYCGNETTDGIYVRANPSEPKFCNHDKEVLSVDNQK